MISPRTQTHTHSKEWFHLHVKGYLATRPKNSNIQSKLVTYNPCYYAWVHGTIVPCMFTQQKQPINVVNIMQKEKYKKDISSLN